MDSPKKKVALDRDLLTEICSNFIRNPDIKHFEQLSAEPFKLYLVDRTTNRCMLDLLWNYPSVSLFSNTASLDMRKDDPSTSKRIDMDHSILEYFLGLNPHFIHELHVWKSSVEVLRKIQTDGIRKIGWFHPDNFLYDDIMAEFMRIFRENCNSLKYLEIDYTFITFVPFYMLKLNTLVIPNYGGTLDEPFIKELNTQTLVLKEATQLCRLKDCLACENKCEFSMNMDLKHFSIEFSRALSEEFRHLLNIVELLSEMPLHFPRLQTFEFVAEQEAVVEGNVNPMASMNEFRRAIRKYEVAMEFFKPTNPFDFYIHISCFCRPQLTLRFGLTKLLDDFEVKELTEEDKKKYVWRKLEKKFDSNEKRILTLKLC